MKKTPPQLDPNTIRSRDYALVALINGATKAGAHKNRRKEASRKACRVQVLKYLD